MLHLQLFFQNYFHFTCILSYRLFYFRSTHKILRNIYCKCHYFNIPPLWFCFHFKSFQRCWSDRCKCRLTRLRHIGCCWSTERAVSKMSRKQMQKTVRSNKKGEHERKRDERAARRAIAKDRKNRPQDDDEGAEFVSFSNQLQALGLKLREVPGDG